MAESVRERRAETGQSCARGRLSAERWQARARYVLRFLDDPIALQRSPLCRLTAVEELAKAKHPNGVVARGRVLNALAHDCLHEIESELDGHSRVTKLRHFIALTLEGKSVVAASRAVGVSREYALRVFKKQLLELFVEKMQSKLR